MSKKKEFKYGLADIILTMIVILILGRIFGFW